MPTWNLIYRIGINCTQEDFHREQQIFCSDLRCISYQCTESRDSPGIFAVQIAFNEPMSLASQEILHRRVAEAVPAIPVLPLMNPIFVGNMLQVQVSLSDTQEGSTLLIGDVVRINEQGQIGSRGNPIGIVLHVDPEANQARINIATGTPINTDAFQSRNSMQEYRDPPRFSRGEVELARVTLERMPMELMDPQMFRARQEVWAEEDARILEALGALANLKEPKDPPEPRPVFKSRYQRILDSFK
jgi:hypothetical protein